MVFCLVRVWAELFFNTFQFYIIIVVHMVLSLVSSVSQEFLLLLGQKSAATCSAFNSCCKMAAVLPGSALHSRQEGQGEQWRIFFFFLEWGGEEELCGLRKGGSPQQNSIQNWPKLCFVATSLLRWPEKSDIQQSDLAVVLQVQSLDGTRLGSWPVCRAGIEKQMQSTDTWTWDEGKRWEIGVDANTPPV